MIEKLFEVRHFVGIQVDSFYWISVFVVKLRVPVFVYGKFQLILFGLCDIELVPVKYTYTSWDISFFVQPVFLELHFNFSPMHCWYFKLKQIALVLGTHSLKFNVQCMYNYWSAGKEKFVKSWKVYAYYLYHKKLSWFGGNFSGDIFIFYHFSLSV